MKKNKVSGIKYQVSSIRYQVLVRSFVYCLLSVAFLSFLSACGGDDEETIAPKPRAYFRLAFPEKKYVKYDSVCPFTFEMPVYASMDNDKNAGAEPCWINFNFPTLHATVHLSYEPINNNLDKYLDNTYVLVAKHTIKASGINEEVVSRDSAKVYGLIYNIGGNAASQIQFFLTDSTENFIRGALYFNAVPNTDSVHPAMEFIKEDIYHMIETFQWKNKIN